MGYDLKAPLVKEIMNLDLHTQGQGSKVQVNS